MLYLMPLNSTEESKSPDVDTILTCDVEIVWFVGYVYHMDIDARSVL